MARYKYCKVCKLKGVQYSTLSHKQAIEKRHPYAKGRDRCRYCGDTNYK